MSTIATQQQQGSNETAFEAAFQRYYALIVRFAYSRTYDLDLAQDIAQETFLRCYQKLGAYSFEGRFSTWLLRVAHNLSVGFRVQLSAVAEQDEPPAGELLNETLRALRLVLQEVGLEGSYVSEATVEFNE